MSLRTIIWVMTACLFGITAARAPAASLQQPAGNADNDVQAALAKTLALLNSPDPAVRLATFELAPPVNRKLEIEEALISKDPTLRAIGLASFFDNNKKIFIRINRYNRERHYFMDKVGGAFNLYIGNFDWKNFRFSTVTDFNSTRNEGQNLINLAQMGLLSGDRISFGADFDHAGISKCVVNLMLDQALLATHAGFAAGNMSCNNNEHYTVQWLVEPPRPRSTDPVGNASQAIVGVALLPIALLDWGVKAALNSDKKPAPKLSLAERQGQIAQDLDLLNSPDPAVRLATLEVVLANGDRTLRHLLLTSAFAISDPILRDAALAGAVAAADSIPITIVRSDSNNHNLSDRIDGKSYVFIRNFDQKSFTFDTVTEYNRRTYSSQYKRNIDVPQSGLISGSRLSLVADFDAAGADQCNVNLSLDRVGSTARGIMSCSNNEKYTVESDLLK